MMRRLDADDFYIHQRIPYLWYASSTCIDQPASSITIYIHSVPVRLALIVILPKMILLIFIFVVVIERRRKDLLTQL